MSRKLEKQLTDPREMAKSFGQLAIKIKARLKNSTKNGFASASSFEVSAHSFEKFNALSFISFQLNAIL